MPVKFLANSTNQGTTMSISLQAASSQAQSNFWPQTAPVDEAGAGGVAARASASAAQTSTAEAAQAGAGSLRDLARQATPFAAAQAAGAAAPASPPRERSGAQWVNQFPTSRSLDTLTPEFRAGVQGFTQAIRDAGGRVSIAATYRPPERAYLMHYAWKVANGSINPSAVPAHPNVNIQWDHGNVRESRAAARAMVNAYSMAHSAALQSNHTNRTAIDMNVTGMIGKTMNDANGNAVRISSQADLHAVGASYGVHKLVSDPPHWSANGR